MKLKNYLLLIIAQIAFTLSSNAQNSCINICMTALDTVNMKAYIYLDAPELGTGDLYHFLHFETLGLSTTGILNDKDTIVEIPITNINSFHNFKVYTGPQISYPYIPCDSTTFGNLPVTAITVNPNVNKVTANFYMPIALSEIKLLSRPAGTSQYSTLEVK